MHAGAARGARRAQPLRFLPRDVDLLLSMGYPGRTWAALIVALAPALAGADEMYRWVDAQGNVHLSETPPEGANAEVWKPKPLETAPPIPTRERASAPAKPRASGRTPGAAKGSGSLRAPSPASASSGDSDEPRVAGRTEAEWRRDALEKQEQVSTVESKIQAAEEMPEFSSSTFKKGSGGTQIVSGTSKQGILIGLRHELQRAQSDLERFEDYARTQGVPAGWLR
jgi:hypothetical protein